MTDRSDIIGFGSATDRTWVQDWLQLVRGEYEELPGLRLTQSQVEEWWEIDAARAATLIGALVSIGVLRKTREGAYVHADTQEATAIA